MVYKMRLKGYLKETTQPTVKMTIDALTIAFSKIQQIMGQVNLFDIDDKTAINLLRKGFDDISVKLEMGKQKGGVRKYLAGGEFGGQYGKDYAWLIKLLPDFSKVFRKFAKERGMKNFMSHSKNPLFREFVELVSHEILHSQQALNSAGRAFDPEVQGITSTYTGNMKEYLKNPLEIEPYAQQAAIDAIRKGHSVYIATMRDLFPPKSKVWKKFVKKYKFYMEILKKEGDIKPYKK
jgi:hypothetical protein